MQIAREMPIQSALMAPVSNQSKEDRAGPHRFRIGGGKQSVNRAGPHMGKIAPWPTHCEHLLTRFRIRGPCLSEKL